MYAIAYAGTYRPTNSYQKSGEISGNYAYAQKEPRFPVRGRVLYTPFSNDIGSVSV